MTQSSTLPRIANLVLKAGEPGRLLVCFPYHPEYVCRIKTVPGRRWHSELKEWSVPHTPETLTRLERLFSNSPSVPQASILAESRHKIKNAKDEPKSTEIPVLFRDPRTFP